MNDIRLLREGGRQRILQESCMRLLSVLFKVNFIALGLHKANIQAACLRFLHDIQTVRVAERRRAATT